MPKGIAIAFHRAWIGCLPAQRSACAGLTLAAAAIMASAASPAAGQDSTSTGLFARPATTNEAHPIDTSSSGWRWGVFEADLRLRPGYYATWSRERDGTSSEKGDLRARAQMGVSWNPSSVLTFRGRVAGRFSTDQDGLRFYVRDYVPSTSGLLMGDATVDELYVRWQPSDRFDIRVGRLQTAFELVGLAGKSLDRKDSPSTDITWTDGVQASAALGGGWRPQVILQRNGSQGPTSVVRSPLDVTGSGSRVTIVAAIRNERRSGPWVQRDIDVTYIPRSVPRSDGVSPEADDGRDGYLALVARGGIEPGVNVLGGHIVLGAAVGYAPTTPPRTLLGTGTVDDGDGDGWSYHLSANLMDVGDTHSFQLMHLRTGDGWLVSSDIPQNSRDWEGRYYWRYATWGRLDVRLRHRKELRPMIDAEERHRRYDFYVRTTLRFGPAPAPSPRPAAANGTPSRP